MMVCVSRLPLRSLRRHLVGKLTTSVSVAGVGKVNPTSLRRLTIALVYTSGQGARSRKREV